MFGLSSPRSITGSSHSPTWIPHLSFSIIHYYTTKFKSCQPRLLGKAESSKKTAWILIQAATVVISKIKIQCRRGVEFSAMFVYIHSLFYPNRVFFKRKILIFLSVAGIVWAPSHQPTINSLSCILLISISQLLILIISILLIPKNNNLFIFFSYLYFS